MIESSRSSQIYHKKFDVLDVRVVRLYIVGQGKWRKQWLAKRVAENENRSIAQVYFSV